MASKISVEDMTATSDVEKANINLQRFSDAMISIYKESQRLDPGAAKASQIKKISNLIAQDAIHYARDVVPTCYRVVKSFDNFFDLYQDLPEEEWMKSLKYISGKAKECAQDCNELAEQHTKILGKLKGTKIKAENLETAVNKVIEDNKRRQTQFQKEADENDAIASTSSWVPVIGIPFMIYFESQRNEAQNKANEHGRKVAINSLSLNIINEKMIPALEAFINALNALAGFFSKYEASFSNWRTNTSDVDAPESILKSHYRNIRKKNSEMKRVCNSFYIALPDIKSNLLAIEH